MLPLTARNLGGPYSKRKPLLQRRANDPPSFLDDGRPRGLYGNNISNVSNRNRMPYAMNNKRSFDKTVVRPVPRIPSQRRPLSTIAINSDRNDAATAATAHATAPVVAAGTATGQR